MKQFLAPLALLAARAAMPEVESGDDVSGCAGSGLYIIAIRGTGELQGIGVAGSLIGKPVKDEIKDSKLVSLTYPASLSDPNYILSVGNGTTSLNDLINSHVQACPRDKIAIIGYSQGAQVTLDTLCGTDETGFTETAAIASDKIDKHIVAVALMGDPTHVANVTYDRGTSIKDGIFPRKNSAACAKYSNIMASWCDTGDVYCDSGIEMLVHAQYFNKYGTDIVSFIVDKYKGSSSISSSSNGTSSTNNTSTATGGISTGTGTGVGVTSALPASTAASSTSAQSTGSATTSGIAAATSTPGAASTLRACSKGLYLALPLTLAALLQMF